MRATSVLACGRPKANAAGGLVDLVAAHSAANVSPIGPSFTWMVAFQVESSTTSSRVAPGTQGTTRGTSMSSAQAASGAAATSKSFSILMGSHGRRPGGRWR